jgi:hypothetical protein
MSSRLFRQKSARIKVYLAGQELKTSNFTRMSYAQLSPSGHARDLPNIFAIVSLEGIAMIRSVLTSVVVILGVVSQSYAADLAQYPSRPGTDERRSIYQHTSYAYPEDCELLRIDYRSPYPAHSQLVNICTRAPVDLRPETDLPSINGRS